MSILLIFSMTSITRCALARSGSLSISPRTVGTICQETPNLSFNQPHCALEPPAESFSHSSSTSVQRENRATHEQDLDMITKPAINMTAPASRTEVGAISCALFICIPRLARG